MVISSRTPEGQPNHCPVCKSELRIEPSDPAGDAPCPRCGHLLWFTWEDLGTEQLFKPTDRVLSPESLDPFFESVAENMNTRSVLDFGGVESVSSAVLSRLINLKNRVTAASGRVTIRNLPAALKDVFRITRLDQDFDMEP
jgi:anti-anti-sigma factor